MTELAGGFTGGVAAALLNGVKRGLFSNEAGMGSVPNVAATATVSHPVKQGLIQSVAVFVDTMVICTATAFIILVSGPSIYDPATPTRVEGATLTQAAIADSLGTWTVWLVTLLVFVFAFSSVLGNYVYAEINLYFLGAGRKSINVSRVLVLVAIGVGGVSQLTAVWALADVAMGLMALVNLWRSCCSASGRSPRSRTFSGKSTAASIPSSLPRMPTYRGVWRATSGNVKPSQSRHLRGCPLPPKQQRQPTEQ